MCHQAEIVFSTAVMLTRNMLIRIASAITTE